MTDEDIFKEMKNIYGKETLLAKEDDEDWYCSVKNERKEKDRDYAETCGNDNSGMTVREVQSNFSQINNDSECTQSRKTDIQYTLKKRRGTILNALQYIFQKSCESGGLCEIPYAGQRTKIF